MVVVFVEQNHALLRSVAGMIFFVSFSRECISPHVGPQTRRRLGVGAIITPKLAVPLQLLTCCCNCGFWQVLLGEGSISAVLASDPVQLAVGAHWGLRDTKHALRAAFHLPSSCEPQAESQS